MENPSNQEPISITTPTHHITIVPKPVEPSSERSGLASLFAAVFVLSLIVIWLAPSRGIPLLHIPPERSQGGMQR